MKSEKEKHITLHWFMNSTDVQISLHIEVVVVSQ